MTYAHLNNLPLPLLRANEKACHKLTSEGKSLEPYAIIDERLPEGSVTYTNVFYALYFLLVERLDREAITNTRLLSENITVSYAEVV